MILSDSEKRILYQADGYGKSEVLSELRFGISYMPKPEQREAARSLIHKLESLPEKECLYLQGRRGFHYHRPERAGAAWLSHKAAPPL